MKRVLVISGVIVLSFVAGVGTSFLFTTYRSGKSPAAPLSPQTSYRCPSRYEVIASGKYVVIAIPNDREFYIGKNSIPLAGIPDRVRQLIGDLPADQRAVFVKGEASVRYETLSSVIDKIHDADVDRIEIVLDRKKQLKCWTVSPDDSAEQSLAADGAIACFSSDLVPSARTLIARRS